MQIVKVNFVYASETVYPKIGTGVCSHSSQGSTLLLQQGTATVDFVMTLRSPYWSHGNSTD
jgi:hypothetical protein